jgi:hypothetical protein
LLSRRHGRGLEAQRLRLVRREPPPARRPGTESEWGQDRDLQQLRQLLPKDAIRPIYEPKIGAGSQSTLPSGELVIGVNIGDDSRAYPIKTLRFREMVNDRLGGIPILVTW